MKIAVLKERRSHEQRVAATPDIIKKYISLGLQVVVETQAGAGSQISDAAFIAAGATIAANGADAAKDADIVLKVQRPDADELAWLKSGAALIGMLSPYGDKESVQAYAHKQVNAFAMEFIPRITRAQSMDVLSSQSNLAGYRAVIDAAAVFDRAFPMMMTAAGTIAPAKIMVLGAGVAGLQAIATAKRMGAVVSATDVRAAAKEQVESLGGKFVMVESEETKAAETAGGYAKEMSEDYRQKQAALVADTLKKQDIAICTALIPGRKAPILITDEMVHSMQPGSIIIDLAVEQGGNCTLSKPGEIVEINGVKIVGYLNMPSRIARDASQLYAKNLFNFLTPLIAKDAQALTIDWSDEIIKGTALTRDGQVIHPALLS
ncbi:MAG: Re/Si-specific NAD(P)(+) transhydrogenase subunit alpha [Gammaproteobacteria bacterium]|nr:Re/Si-specific NAD(P)(+) transhydrogenase subunit alpha [Gammaproteobacteria bacterium]